MATTGESLFRPLTDTEVDRLAERFTEVLHLGDGGAAETIVAEALAAGLAPEAIQSLVITPAMVRIGEMWELRVIGVADEHLATSICQRALMSLYEAMTTTWVRAPSKATVMLAAVESQHHTLGLRMVADVLEAAGYTVFNLGADVPVDSLRAFAAQRRPDVVGLGIGIASDVSTLADSLCAVHAVSPESRIMLGGRAVPKELAAAGYCQVPSSMDVLAAMADLLAKPPLRLPTAVESLRSDGGHVALTKKQRGETDDVAERMARAAEHAVDLARDHFRQAQVYRDLAFRDPLTDLANRRAFEDALSSATHAGGAGAVLMIDVDKFKQVNDQHGHDAGDVLLRALAQVIRGAVRPGDVAARVGGDEFAVLLPSTTLSVAHEIGERLRAAVSDDPGMPVSLSVGVAPLSADARVALLAADTALYQAKGAGRDCVVSAALPVAV